MVARSRAVNLAKIAKDSGRGDRVENRLKKSVYFFPLQRRGPQLGTRWLWLDSHWCRKSCWLQSDDDDDRVKINVKKRTNFIGQRIWAIKKSLRTNWVTLTSLYKQGEPNRFGRKKTEKSHVDQKKEGSVIIFSYIISPCKWKTGGCEHFHILSRTPNKLIRSK